MKRKICFGKGKKCQDFLTGKMTATNEPVIQF